jgi:hypothetical protein
VTAIPARRRRRLIAAIITSAITMVSLPSGLVLGTNMLLNDSGGQNVETSDAIRIPTTPVHLVALTNARSEVSALALFTLAPNAQGGTIISLPVGSAADVGVDVAPRRLGDSFITGGIDALQTDVQDLLNITIDSASVHNAAEFAVELQAVGTQSITLAQPVVDVDATGTQVVVIEAGATTVTPDKIAAGLVASQVGLDELTRFAAIKSLWSAVSRAGAGTAIEQSDNGAAPTTVTEDDSDAQSPSTLQEYLSGMLLGRIDVWQFNATRITDAQRNPNAVDLYSLDGGEVLMVMASVAPSAMRLVSNNLTVMVDVPFNSSTYAQESVTRLAYAGANVVLVRQIVDTPSEKTVAYVNDSIARAEVETYAGLIGPIEIVETLERIEGVNVRIVLGNEFVAFLGEGGITTTTVAQ